MPNKDVQLTLQDAVGEVLSTLTGLDLEYDPDQDRFRSTVRFLNRALRAIALDQDWSYYASTEEVGQASSGLTSVELSSLLRPRVADDACVRLVNSDNDTEVWAFFLPRDALHKYRHRAGLWVAATRSTIEFSRPLLDSEAGLRIMCPVMREPKMFLLPKDGAALTSRILNQPVDFDYPDLVIAKAAQLMAETDPVMQPRVQTLEAKYKGLMYQLIERDTKSSDTPYQNEFLVPIQGSLSGPVSPMTHGHPHADERWR